MQGQVNPNPNYNQNQGYQPNFNNANIPPSQGGFNNNQGGFNNNQGFNPNQNPNQQQNHGFNPANQNPTYNAGSGKIFVYKGRILIIQ